MEKETGDQNKKEELWRTVKFTLFSISAGAIQLIVSGLLTHFTNFGVATCYFIALVCSVIWNFTFNRKFTFKSASNVPIAMLKVLGYYAVFTPVSTILGNHFTAGGANEYIVLGLTMACNLITEFLFDKFVVFRDALGKE